MVMLYMLWMRDNSDERPCWRQQSKRLTEDAARKREYQINADAIDAREHARETGHKEHWITTVVLPAGEVPWIAKPAQPRQGDADAPD